MLYGGFDIEVDAGDGQVRLVLFGELDVATTDELRSAIRDYLDRDVAVVIDTTQLDFIDSTGLGVLVSARKQLGSDRFQLVPGEATMRIIDLSKTDGFLLDSQLSPADDRGQE